MDPNLFFNTQDLKQEMNLTEFSKGMSNQVQSILFEEFIEIQQKLVNPDIIPILKKNLLNHDQDIIPDCMEILCRKEGKNITQWL